MRAAKRLLALLLSAVLIFTVLPTGVFAVPAGEEAFLLATVSDIHYYPESLSKYKGEAFYTYLRGNNCVYDNLNGILNATFDSLAAEAQNKGLKYVVLCGDLTINGEYEGHVALAERLRKLEEDTGLKVFVINGNHDINNPNAADFSYADGMRHSAKMTTAAEFYDIYREFGFDEAVSAYSAPDTGKAGALSYAVVADGYRLIMVDAGKYTADNTAKKRDIQETGGNITPEVFEWISQQVDAAKENGETPLVFTHWNASEMNYMHGEVLQGFVIDNAYRLQETFADMGVHFVFSGHQHATDIDVTYSDAGEPLYSVITPTLTEFPFAYRETKFTKDASGTVTADFSQIDCDSVSVVQSDKGTIYMRPYRQSGFYLQHGNGEPETYLMWLAKGLLSKFMDQIREEGSIVAFLKSQFDFDVEQKIDDLINGGFSFGNIDILTVSDIMSFIADLDQQIMDTYINDPDRLWNAIESSLRDLMNTKVSDVPCTKFINEYGFGDRDKPGTIGDLFYSVIAYMYYGNEDISDDAFMQDVLKKAGQPAFVDLIFSAAEEYIVEDFVVNEILANLYVHINTLFNGRIVYVTDFLQIVYRVFTGFTKENIFRVSSTQEFVSKLWNLGALLTYDNSSITYKYLLEYLLSSGILKYGKNVRELVYYFINQYFDAQNKEATAEQLRVILEGDVTDPDPDWNVTYSDAATEVVPSVEDMQLPNDVTARVQGNTLTLHWLTKYSVTGTDIEIREKESGEAVPADRIETACAPETYTGFGFDFGSFGILPYTRDINAHTLDVQGLVPGKTYVYSIGDAGKGFMTEPAEILIPAAEADSFSFLYLSDFAASTQANAARFAKTFSAAAENEKAEFAVLGGSSALNGKDDTQFSSVINAASSVLSEMPVWYVPGDADVSEQPNLIKHYNIPSPDVYNNDNLGSYYSFDRLNAHFAVLNTNDLEPDGTLSLVQLQWLREDLEGSHAKWNIVVMDTPVFTGNAENAALANQMRVLCDSLSVDVLLQGGARSYYRSNMLSAGEFVTGGDTIIKTIGGRVFRSLVSIGTLCVAAGTAGTAYVQAYENKDLYKTVFTQAAPVYTTICVYENDITFDVYAVNDAGVRTSVDSFAVTKSGEKRKLGDIDGDGSVTASDARLALRNAVGLQTLQPAQKLAADVDFSRSITAADARAILRAAVDLEPIVPETIEYYRKDLENVNF